MTVARFHLDEPWRAFAIGDSGHALSWVLNHLGFLEMSTYSQLSAARATGAEYLPIWAPLNSIDCFGPHTDAGEAFGRADRSNVRIGAFEFKEDQEVTEDA